MPTRFRVPINPFTRTAILAFILFAVAGMSPAAAQGTPTSTPTVEPTLVPTEVPEEITLGAVRCNDARCTDLGDVIGGMEMSVFDAGNDQFLDSCVTDATSGTCVVSIPAGLTFAVRIDTSAIPDGYTHFQGGMFIVDGVSYMGFVPVEDPHEMDTIKVRAVLCADDACDEIDSALIEFEIFAVDKDTGEVLNSCITGSSQQHADCLMDIPAGTHLLLQGDKEAVPDGYVRVPGHGSGDGDPPLLTLFYAPEGEDSTTPTPTPKTPVSSLPGTGAGDDASGAEGSVLALGTLGVTLLAIAGAARLNGRQSRR
jgi:hypothetical protein